MQAELDLAAHRQRVLLVLAEANEAQLAALVAEQGDLRHSLAEALAPPVYQPQPWAAGGYPVGLPDAVLAEFGIRVVGGAVRDRLIGRSDYPDIDCVVPAHHWQAWLHYAEQALYRPRSVPRALSCKLQAGPAAGREFVCSRHDSYGLGGQLLLAQPAELRADPWRRDFTLQALYADPSTGHVWDPFDACRARELRAVLPGTLVEDPLRVVRLVRMQVTHRLVIDPDTEAEARQVAQCPCLSARVERHRTLAEFDRAARAGVLGPMLRQLAQWQWPGIQAPDAIHDSRVARSATQWLRQAGMAL